VHTARVCALRDVAQSRWARVASSPACPRSSVTSSSRARRRCWAWSLRCSTFASMPAASRRPSSRRCSVSTPPYVQCRVSAVGCRTAQPSTWTRLIALFAGGGVIGVQYYIAFGVPAALLTLATLVFWAGLPTYRIVRLHLPSPRDAITQPYKPHTCLGSHRCLLGPT
jgi:hypothetical protein